MKYHGERSFFSLLIEPSGNSGTIFTDSPLCRWRRRSRARCDTKIAAELKRILHKKAEEECNEQIAEIDDGFERLKRARTNGAFNYLRKAT